MYINKSVPKPKLKIMKTNTNIQVLSNQMFHIWATISSVRAFGLGYDERDPKTNLTGKTGV